MDLGEILQGSSLLILVVAIFLCLIVGLILFILWQNQKIKELQTSQNTGFLGKPLVIILTMVVLVGGLATTIAVNQSFTQEQQALQSISVSNSYQLEVEIMTNTTILNSRETKVEFEAIPVINGEMWGGDEISSRGWEYDIFWTIKGPRDFAQIELDVIRSNPGGFTRTLPRGAYEVKVEMIHQGITYEKIQTINL